MIERLVKAACDEHRLACIIADVTPHEIAFQLTAQRVQEMNEFFQRPDDLLVRVARIFRP